MTLDPAYASFQEQDIGSLEVGKKADFVIFDRDFVDCGDEGEESCNGSEILGAKVKAVIIDGKVVRGTLPQPRDNVTFWGIISKLGAYVHATGLF
jgi:predicted amidohydrolase YtcJ